MFTGISGSYTSANAAMIASSVGRGSVSPSGVQAAWDCVTSFTARLLAAFQCRDQCVPGKRRALNPRRVFVHPGQRLKSLHWFGQRGVALRAFARAREFTKCIEKCVCV